VTGLPGAPGYRRAAWATVTLDFGAFTTPAHESAETVVELAGRVGLDLVTFQDHPYQRRFLDTWTLLSYVAGGPSASGWPRTS
jgi:alkanesulfonate monooxygenase SsuD/methylene tetrahydromethanopterin reductase-like flavin-dependent oxidoreductase (luciferase family)